MTDPFSAAFKGDATALAAWLAANPTKVNEPSTDRGTTLLYTAARFGHGNCVKLLVDDYHADTNLRNTNKDRSLPLHGAAYGGHSDVVDLLLERGAKNEVKNGFGETPKDNAESPAPDVTATQKKSVLEALSKKRGEKKKAAREEDLPRPSSAAKASKKEEANSDGEANGTFTHLVNPNFSTGAKGAPSTQKDDDNDHNQDNQNNRYYNQVARNRAFGTTVKRDQHGNVQGALGDLGLDGAFTGWRMLVFTCYVALPGSQAKAALTRKGWDLTQVMTEKECVQELESGTYDLFVLMSGGAKDGLEGATSKPDYSQAKAFTKAVKDFHLSGRGCLIAADNVPLFIQANWVLEDIFDGMQLEGTTPAAKNLTPGNPLSAGHYDSRHHLITAGIDAQIYEGVTICYPVKKTLDLSKFTVFGTSTDNHPVLLATTDEYSGISKEKPGRIVIDCGWTKFMDGMFSSTAGTERYLTNAITWLANTERFEEPVAPHLAGKNNNKGKSAAASQQVPKPKPKGKKQK